jgi:hypothetical protein
VWKITILRKKKSYLFSNFRGSRAGCAPPPPESAPELWVWKNYAAGRQYPFNFLGLNTSTVTDSLCNSGAFSNPNAVRDCPFKLKGAWFLSRSRKFFFVCSAIVFKAFQRGPTKYFLQKKILFHVDLIKMLSLISLFLRFPSYIPQNSG